MVAEFRPGVFASGVMAGEFAPPSRERVGSIASVLTASTGEAGPITGRDTVIGTGAGIGVEAFTGVEVFTGGIRALSGEAILTGIPASGMLVCTPIRMTLLCGAANTSSYSARYNSKPLKGARF